MITVPVLRRHISKGKRNATQESPIVLALKEVLASNSVSEVHYPIQFTAKEYGFKEPISAKKPYSGNIQIYEDGKVSIFVPTTMELGAGDKYYPIDIPLPPHVLNFDTKFEGKKVAKKKIKPFKFRMESLSIREVDGKNVLVVKTPITMEK